MGGTMVHSDQRAMAICFRWEEDGPSNVEIVDYHG